MKQITIISNNLELEYVSETLTIKRDNNSFDVDFKVAHTSQPFLIIENETTKDALGPRDITSIGKQKVIEVDVIELGETYKGELQILKYIDGFRKCNLKYASELYPLLKSKIRDFMPVVSVIPNETNPVPYTETSEDDVAGASNWSTFAENMLNDVFPQAKLQLPKMKYSNLFGDLEAGDSWESYQNYINNYDQDENTLQYTLIENDYSINGSQLNVYNRNVISPQIFLLSPLFFALQSIGFKLKGEFVDNSFIRRILLLSKENNLTEISKTPDSIDLEIPNVNFIYNNPYYQGYPIITETFTVQSSGSYRLKYKFIFNTSNSPYTSNNNSPNTTFLSLMFSGSFPSLIYNKSLYNQLYNGDSTFTVEGEFDFNVESAYVNQDLTVFYCNKSLEMPVFQSIEIYRTDAERKYYQMHPTINTSRYIPDWTVAKYINELKKTFNLKVTPNDFKKELVINFNENINVNTVPTILNKSFKIAGYNSVANTSFTLRFANDVDNALFITRDNTELLTTQEDAFNKEWRNQFKLVDHNSVTTELSDELHEKDGVGLMIYDVANKPYISDNYLSQQLQFEGPTGLYAKFWRKWLNFRLNASSLEIEGPLTEIEISKISKTEEIYIDHQHYRISSYQFTEVRPGINKVKFQLESVNL
ncbi:hypothetical protein OOZ35_00380 [Mesoflavibacter profundi]|uniref:Uncharacterized protein n=2 Tax=Mesoflavibacter profundi TaxID=2708110 RepID=A0ABT4RVT8_9FLAO|nr:hypothetical protein [Mesoflavibacter profundi]MDA0175881.1 hypothetical protein [Mesoflavibacter profundi]MDA0175942.1 hypothetical protein [Mesoflavibacter profundi]